MRKIIIGLFILSAYVIFAFDGVIFECAWKTWATLLIPVTFIVITDASADKKEESA